MRASLLFFLALTAGPRLAFAEEPESTAESSVSSTLTPTPAPTPTASERTALHYARWQTDVMLGSAIDRSRFDLVIGARLGYGIPVAGVVFVPGVNLTASQSGGWGSLVASAKVVLARLGRLAPYGEIGFGVGAFVWEERFGAAPHFGGGFVIHADSGLGVGLGAIREFAIAGPSELTALVLVLSL